MTWAKGTLAKGHANRGESRRIEANRGESRRIEAMTPSSLRLKGGESREGAGQRQARRGESRRIEANRGESRRIERRRARGGLETPEPPGGHSGRHGRGQDGKKASGKKTQDLFGTNAAKPILLTRWHCSRILLGSVSLELLQSSKGWTPNQTCATDERRAELVETMPIQFSTFNKRVGLWILALGNGNHFTASARIYSCLVPSRTSPPAVFSAQLCLLKAPTVLCTKQLSWTANGAP